MGFIGFIFFIIYLFTAEILHIYVLREFLEAKHILMYALNVKILVFE